MEISESDLLNAVIHSANYIDLVAKEGSLGSNKIMELLSKTD